MIRFAHRLLVVVLTLLAVGTGLLGIVSYIRPMGFGLVEPTWFSRAVDGYPSRWASFDKSWDPAELRVFTFVGVWDGRGRTIRAEGPFQGPPDQFAQRASRIKSTPAKTWAAFWPDHVQQRAYSGRPDINWRLVRFHPDRMGPRLAYSMLEVSIWLPLVLFSVYPVIALFRGPLRRCRRRWWGCCIRCGYDLTGNESGVCPECGRLFDEHVQRILDLDTGDSGPPNSDS